MSAPLSDQLFNSKVIHRGLGSSKVKTPLGIHWSEERRPAEDFGAPHRTIDEKGNYVTSKGTVVHGKVNENAIIDPYSREGAKFRKKYSILHPDSSEEQDRGEEEVTVRPGATVRVDSLTRIRSVGNIKKKRKIKYNPPREMQA